MLTAPRTTAFLIALLLGAATFARADEPPNAADTVAVPAEEHFPVVLGSFTTTLAGSRPERTANVRLAAEALDGLVLEAGQVFSFDAVVGPRTVERGYQRAPVILHESRQLQTGGGVCQNASTVFVAGLLAGLTPLERWRHTAPVDYIAFGEDATISWGAKDLKLRNDTGQRVRVRCFVRGATLNARFEGEEASPVSFELVTDERELPADPGVEDAQPGREIELYRVRMDARGGESREFLHRDTYPPTRGASGGR